MVPKKKKKNIDIEILSLQVRLFINFVWPVERRNTLFQNARRFVLSRENPRFLDDDRKGSVDLPEFPVKRENAYATYPFERLSLSFSLSRPSSLALSLSLLVLSDAFRKEAEALLFEGNR